MNKNIKIILLAFFAGIAGAFCHQWFSSFFNSTDSQTTRMPEYGKSKLVKNERNIAPLSSTDFVLASSLSTQSVVYIKTVADQKYDPFSLFDFYFGDNPGNRKITGSGSGVIFTSDGYIVTNYHVIEDAEKIEVIHKKKSYEAKIIGTDPNADLAIIKISTKNLPNIKLGSSKNLQVGEWVIAVGNPFNLNSTVTAGIVSAKGRDIDLLKGRFPLESFIQTDAAINPGNSGGALVNTKGELVGINTAILSRTGYYTGYGFAVPVDIVSKIFNDLIQFGEVQKAFSGLSITDLNSEIASKFGITNDDLEGALVTNVQPGTEAEKAAIKNGDVILKINNEPINGKSSYEENLSYYRPGDKVKISFRRGSQTIEKTITLTNREGTTSVLKSEIYTSDAIGVDLEVVSKVEKEKLDIKEGVRVVKVKKGLFSRLGIEEGFIITAINRREIKKPEDVEEILSNIGGRVVIEGVTKNGVKGHYSFYF